MLKKVTSAALAMFICSCAIGSISSASINKDGSTTNSSYDSSNANVYNNDGLPPGRQCKKWAEYQKNLAKQQNNQSNNKKWGKNCNDAYALDSEEEKEEQLQEDEDLDDMRTKAVWERRKK